ncbi:MAG: ribonuclease Z, partial [Bacteroidota bacterium]
MDFELTVLGNSSATPTKYRHPSAQLLSLNGRMFLIDCGEATQIQLRRFHIRFSKIDHIFISHLHGDHYLGIFGFLSTLHLLGRKKTLKIYAPQGLQELVELYIRISNPEILYPIEFITLKEENPENIYEDNNLTIHSFPMDHRIECYGFIFRQKQQLPRMRKE